MPYSELLNDLIYTTRHGAGFILRRFGRVVPGGVYFVNPDDPLVDFTFPKEDHPQATDEALLAMTEQELRRWAAKPETCAVALAVEIAHDGRRVMAIQAETRGEVAVVHCPLRRKLWWWVLGEAEEAEGLIVERFFADGQPADGPSGGPDDIRPLRTTNDSDDNDTEESNRCR